MNSGHKAYVGFLYLEHTYNNAVVNMFVTLMMNGVRAGRKDNVHGGSGDTCKWKSGFSESVMHWILAHTSVLCLGTFFQSRELGAVLWS